jgi:hypothetical protein
MTNRLRTSQLYALLALLVLVAIIVAVISNT